MKKFLIIALSCVLASSQVFASDAVATFFEWQNDYWNVIGMTVDGERACTSSTFWKDGSSAMIVASEDHEGFGLLVSNKDWNIKATEGSHMEVATIFKSPDGSMSGLRGTAIVVDDQTIMFPGLTDSFFEHWITDKAFILDMPGAIDDLGINLTGSKESLKAFVDCSKFFTSGTNL